MILCLFLFIIQKIFMGIIKETANTQINSIHKWNACFPSESYAILTAKPYLGDCFQRKSQTKTEVV